MKKSFLCVLFLCLVIGQPCWATPDAVRIEATFEIQPVSGSMYAEGTIWLPSSSDIRKQIELHLTALARDVHFDVPERGLTIENIEQKPDQWDTRWLIRLDTALSATDRVAIHFSYRIEDPEQPQFRITNRGSFAGSGGETWYPQKSWNDREVGLVKFRVPAGQVVVANGVLLETTLSDEVIDYLFHIDEPSKLGFAMGRYKIISSAGDVPCDVYLLGEFPQSADFGRKCADTIVVLQELFGAFPYGRTRLVEVDFNSLVKGTSEYGFIFADQDQFAGEFNVLYWAHELAHQWWGTLIKVRSQTPGATLMTEGLSEFAALRAIQALQGEVVADTARRELLEKYEALRKSGKDLSLLTVPADQEQILDLHRLSTSKGALGLAAIDEAMGKGRFDGLLKQFVAMKRGKTTSWQEFQTFLSDQAGDRVNELVNAWFEEVDLPATVVEPTVSE